MAPRSSNDETNLQSDHDGKMTVSSLVGFVQARRYKVLEAIFFHKLESVIQSGDGGLSPLHAPASQTWEHSVALPDTKDVIRRFNRDTRCVATGVLGTVVFAGLMLAFLVQERYPLSLNTNVATLAENVVLTGKSSTEKMISGQASSVDQAFTEIFPKENPSSQMEAAASTLTPVLAFTPQINRHDVQATADLWTLEHRQDAGRVIGLNVPRRRSRSSVRPRFVDVKMRLIELWHQSLARSERSRSWTPFSSSNKGDRKKISYTAQMNH
jgi:hypothetical protein